VPELVLSQVGSCRIAEQRYALFRHIHLMGMHLTGVCVMGMYLIGVCLMGARLRSTQTVDGASMVAGDAAVEVHGASSLVRGEDGPVMVDISNFTTAKILDNRSSSFGVEYRYERKPPMGRFLITEGEETSIPRDTNALEEDEGIGSVFSAFSM
jgi:hypothetical protein